MGLETGTYIDDLVTTNPVGGVDLKSSLDDQDRLIKTVIKNSFPDKTFPTASKNDGGVADAYTVTLSPAPGSYADYTDITVRIANANTGAATLNLNGLGAKAIKKFYNEALDSGDLAAGSIHRFVYDATAGYWQLMSPPASVLRSAATGVQTFLTTPSSANLAAAVTDETGTGALVFGTNPAFIDTTLDINTFHKGKNTGGTAYNLIGVDGTDIVQVGNATLATVLNGSTLTLGQNLTLNGKTFTGAAVLDNTVTLSNATPTLNVGSANVSTGTAAINVGINRTGDGESVINFIAGTTYTSYGLRLRRLGGANGISELQSRGTGAFYLYTLEAAPIYIRTTDTDRVMFQAGGNVNIVNNLKIGGAVGDTPAANLDVASGTLRVGVDDSVVGNINLMGAGAGSSVGGTLALYNAADHDGTSEYTQIYQWTDDTYIDANVNSGGFLFVFDLGLKLPHIGTTASAATLFVDTGASNNVLRSTSSELIKTGFEPIEPQRVTKFMDEMEMFYFKSTAEADKLPDGTPKSFYYTTAEKAFSVDPRLAHLGYLPEDYEIVETCEMVEFTKQDGTVIQIPGEVKHEHRLKAGVVPHPTSVDSNGHLAFMFEELKRHRAEIAELKSKLN